MAVEKHLPVKIPPHFAGESLVQVTQWYVEQGVFVTTGTRLACIEGAKASCDVCALGDGYFFPTEIVEGDWMSPTDPVGLLSDASEPRLRLTPNLVDERSSNCSLEVLRQNQLRLALSHHNNSAVVSRSVVAVDQHVAAQLLEKVRVSIGIVSLGEIIVWLVAKTLRGFPELNGIVEENNFVHREDINIGLVVDLGDETSVPVIPACDSLGLLDCVAMQKEFFLAVARRELNPKTQKNGTFTISNLLGQDIVDSSPILNVAQVGSLAIVDENPGELRLILSFDHRFIRGRYVSDFLRELKCQLAIPDDGWVANARLPIAKP